MTELIVAINEDEGIGNSNTIPWKCPEDLKIFRKKTMDKTIVVGRNTCDALPFLEGRNVLCLSSKNYINTNWKNPVTIINNLENIKGKIFICGGEKVYKYCLNLKNFISKVHLSVINNNIKCDKYFNTAWLKDFIITKHEIKDKKWNHYILERKSSSEYQYLNLLKKIISIGKKRQGRNGLTLSLFVEHLSFNLQEGFPLLTTKKMFTRGIIEEFLFFLRGNTDTTYLSDRKVRIWEGNTSSEFIKSRNLKYKKGLMGPMYGYQWRFFGAEYKLDSEGNPIPTLDGIDQIKKVVDQIRNNPGSRRILLTSYNPLQAEEGVLYPCHSISIQFYVDGEFLDMFCFNRSQDTFLGVPYNIASSSLLLTVIAKITNKKPRHLKMTMGDTHLYQDHIYQGIKQSTRIPFKFPKLSIPDIKSVEQIKNLKTEDFIISEYLSHPKISAKMII